MSRHVEKTTALTVRFGRHGRMTGSHLKSMHSMDNYYVSELLPLMTEADVAAIVHYQPITRDGLKGIFDKGISRDFIAGCMPVA